MAGLKTPIVSVVIGEGGSGGALALGVADRVWMLENAVYSVISPEGCASILYKDASKADEAAAALGLTAQDLLRLGIIDAVIDEGDGDARTVGGQLAEHLRATLPQLEALGSAELLKTNATQSTVRWGCRPYARARSRFQRLCLTRDEARQLGVELVPMTYVVDGASRPETFMGENGDFDALLDAGRVGGTEGVRADAFAPVFRRLASAGDDVLCIAISAKLSGTYRHACEAADAVRSELRREARRRESREANSGRRGARAAGLPRIAVLDSQSGVGGTEFLVRAARRLADGGAGFDEVLAALEAQRGEQGICFSVPSTEALRASGRLAMVPLSVNTLLNRFPVLTMRNGAISHVEETVRGTQALAREMAAQVPADASDVVITHFGARGAATVELLRAAKEHLPQAQIRVKEGGPVLSYILGSGATSISWGPAGEK